MTSFNDRTFNGSVQFTIGKGHADLRRVSDELGLGFALSAGVATTAGFSGQSFDIIHGVAPVSEQQK